MFEARRLARFNSCSSVQTETVKLRAQLLDDHGPAWDGPFRDTTSLYSCTWLGAERGATLDRGVGALFNPSRSPESPFLMMSARVGR